MTPAPAMVTTRASRQAVRGAAKSLCCQGCKRHAHDVDQSCRLLPANLNAAPVLAAPGLRSGHGRRVRKVDGKGVVTANRVFQLSGTGISLGPFHVNQTYVPAVGNKTPLVATAVCPAALSQTTMEYSSFILRADMKQHLRLRTVGNSGAVTLYDFVKR